MGLQSRNDRRSICGNDRKGPVWDLSNPYPHAAIILIENGFMSRNLPADEYSDIP